MNNDRLQRNLEAMATFSPGALEVLKGTTISPAWDEIRGSDGTITMRRLWADRQEWLGGTSMPRAAAAAMTASMTVGTGLGLGIGTGYEWKHFIGKMTPQQLLYVMELDPELAGLVLSVCDLSAELDAGKLVLLVGGPQEVKEQMRGILDRHSGMEPPGVMHPLPTLVGERRNAVLSAGEAAIRAAVLARSSKMEQVGGKNWQPAPGKRVGMLLQPRHRWERAAHVGLETLWLDHHVSGGRLARLELLLQQRPEVVVSDVWRAELEVNVPAEVSVETWVGPMVGMGFWEGGRLGAAVRGMGPRDRVVVQASAHGEWLVRAGVSADRIRLEKPQLPEGAGAKGEARVVLVADVPGVGPEEYGVTLPSHVAIWEAAREMIAEDPLGMHWDVAGDLLRRAQARTGVEVTDNHLADLLTMGIKLALMEGVVPLTVARELNAAGVPLLLVGRGWEQAGLAGKVEIRGFPSAAEDWPTGVFLRTSPSGIVSPAMMEAATAGLTAAAAAHPHDARPGGVLSVLDEAKVQRLSKFGWVQQVKRLLAKTQG